MNASIRRLGFLNQFVFEELKFFIYKPSLQKSILCKPKDNLLKKEMELAESFSIKNCKVLSKLFWNFI